MLSILLIYLDGFRYSESLFVLLELALMAHYLPKVHELTRKPIE